MKLFKIFGHEKGAERRQNLKHSKHLEKHAWYLILVNHLSPSSGNMYYNPNEINFEAKLLINFSLQTRFIDYWIWFFWKVKFSYQIIFIVLMFHKLERNYA